MTLVIDFTIDYVSSLKKKNHVVIMTSLRLDNSDGFSISDRYNIILG